MNFQMPDLEARPYGPDCTEDERNAISDQVVKVSDRVLLYRETPIVARYSLDVIFERLGELAKEIQGRPHLIIDLTLAKPPNGEMRRYLSGHFKQLNPAHVAVFTGANILLNIAAKFVLGNVFGGLSFSVHKSLTDAMAEIDRKLQQS